MEFRMIGVFLELFTALWKLASIGMLFGSKHQLIEHPKTTDETWHNLGKSYVQSAPEFRFSSVTACWFQFLRSRKIWSHLVWTRCLIWMWPWSNKRKSRLNRLQSRNLSRSVPCLRYMTWFNHYWIPQRIKSYPGAVEVVTQISRFERRSFPTQLWTMTFLTFFEGISYLNNKWQRW